MATEVDTPGEVVAARQAKSRQVPPGRPKARVAEVGAVLPHCCPIKMIWSIQQAGSETLKGPLTWCFVRVSDGARTRDNRDHKAAGRS